MAKFKPAGSKKPAAAPQARGAIPCIIIIIFGIGIVCLLFYFSLKSGAP